MVTGASAADAVERARRLPGLRIGLHIVLVEGTPALAPQRVPDLVDDTGRFRTDMPSLGFDIFAHRSIRRQLAAEIAAQFERFRDTGLALDHVNAHKHFHLHPSIARTIIAVGSEHGMRGLRVPVEPHATLRRAEPGMRRGAHALVTPWAKLLARSARRAGLRTPDAVFGLAWSGAMTTKRLMGLLEHLPAGCSEIYLHPATRDEFDGHAAGYRYADELAALVSPEVSAAARRPDVALGGYAEFD
jgi:hopanoid biosynthesis associated protein HpnK